MSINLRSFSEFVLHSRLRATVVAFFLVFVPFLGSLSIVLAALVTLRKGAFFGALVTVASTVPCVLMLQYKPMPMGGIAIVFVISSNFLTWIFAFAKKHWYEWGRVLEVLAFLGVGTVVLVHAINFNVTDFWAKQMTIYWSELSTIQQDPNALQNLVNKMKAQPLVKNSNKENITPSIADNSGKNKSTKLANSQSILEPEVISFINLAKSYVTGIVISFVLFGALFQVYLAQLWYSYLFPTMRRINELHNIRLSPMMGIVFIVTIMLSYFNIGIPLDVSPVLYLVFCCSGLSLLHYLCAKFKGLAWLGLFVLYSMLLCIWMSYHLTVLFELVSLLGLMDVWVNWREKLNKVF